MKKLLFTFIIAVSNTNAFAQPTGTGSSQLNGQDELSLNTITTALPFMAIYA